MSGGVQVCENVPRLTQQPKNANNDIHEHNRKLVSNYHRSVSNILPSFEVKNMNKKWEKMYFIFRYTADTRRWGWMMGAVCQFYIALQNDCFHLRLWILSYNGPVNSTLYSTFFYCVSDVFRRHLYACVRTTPCILAFYHVDYSLGRW